MPKITGADKVQAKLTGAGSEKVVTLVGQALFAGGEMIRAEAAHLITENAVSGKGHVPSLPGQPPNENTGTLRNNIETTQVAPLQVEVSSNAPYAAALEDGAEKKAGHFYKLGKGSIEANSAVRVEYGDSKTAPRPYMAPASHNVKKDVVALVQQAVNKALES